MPHTTPTRCPHVCEHDDGGAVAASSFAVLLRQYRLASGLTQENLAERATLSARAISDLERGLKKTPRPSTVRLLAQALGLRSANLAHLLAAAQRRRPDASPTHVQQMPGQLPRQLSSFVGRQRELDELRRLLRGTALVTLIGPGGVGKTRLALQIGAEVLTAGETPVALAELAGVKRAERIPETIGHALGIVEQRGRSPTAALVDGLRDRELLLLLDNCEHLVDACAKLVAKLLAHCPNLHILATSREVLRVPGETVWQVPPLELPPLHIGRGSALDHQLLREQLQTAEAVQLFVDPAADACLAFS